MHSSATSSSNAKAKKKRVRPPAASPLIPSHVYSDPSGNELAAVLRSSLLSASLCSYTRAPVYLSFPLQREKLARLTSRQKRRRYHSAGARMAESRHTSASAELHNEVDFRKVSRLPRADTEGDTYSAEAEGVERVRCNSLLSVPMSTITPEAETERQRGGVAQKTKRPGYHKNRHATVNIKLATRGGRGSSVQAYFLGLLRRTPPFAKDEFQTKVILYQKKKKQEGTLTGTVRKANGQVSTSSAFEFPRIRQDKRACLPEACDDTKVTLPTGCVWSS